MTLSPKGVDMNGGEYFRNYFTIIHKKKTREINYLCVVYKYNTVGMLKYENNVVK